VTLVLFVSSNETAPWLASEELWSQTAARMAAAGRHEVAASVRGWTPEAPQLALLEQSGCALHRRRGKGDEPGLLLDRLSPDHVVLSQTENLEGLEWMEACAARSLRYVTVAHGASEHRWPRDDEAARLAAGYERAEACYFVSRANLSLTRRQLGAPLAHARIAPIPYRVSFDAPWTWPADDGIVRLACVARLEPAQKGQDVLFDVLAQPRWRERPLEVTLFGDGEHRLGLAALRETLVLDSVRIAGFAADVESIWRDHHALVLPSRWEGLPAVIVEAMLCGRHAIVTDVAGNGELVSDGVTGFVAKAPVVELLDEAMERAWRELARWPDIGRAAAAAVRELVPADPVGVFRGELEGLLGG
jgi:glycosyltransferase involved in cell wall biosynthesis